MGPAVAPPRRPSLKPLVAEVVAEQADLCHALVDTKSVGEGLQSEAHGQVDSRPVGVSVQHCQLMSTGNSADKLKSKSGVQQMSYIPHALLKQVKSLRVMRN